MKEQKIYQPCSNCSKLVKRCKWQIESKYKRKNAFCNLQCRYSWQKTLKPFLGKHHTKESREKNRLAHLGKIPYMKGKHHTKESREKMSNARKKYFKNNPNAILELVKLQTGRKQSSETIEKRVSKLRGKKRPKWVKNKLKLASRKKENHHFWKGGISQGNYSIRRSTKSKEWRVSVFERDNYTCQDCNKRGNILNAHHLKEFSNFPKLRFEISNGITLCEKCHKIRHKKYKHH